MMKKIYTLLMIACCFGFVQNSNAQCAAGEAEVFIDVITDAYGYEVYWELVPSGNPCGTGAIFTGGNTAVGCAGGGLGAQNPGGYASNTTISEGGFCLVIGQNYDIIAVDDWGDGGTCFEIVGGQTFCQGDPSSNDVFTFTAQAPPDHNLAIKGVYYDSLGAPINSVDSMSTRYYHMIPRRQSSMDSIFFGADVKNTGGTTQTNVNFNVTVNDGSNDVYIGNATSSSMATGTSETMQITNPMTLYANGFYEITFSVDADSTDAVPGDNIFLDTVLVTDTVYARDDGNYTGWGGWIGSGEMFSMCNFFEVFADDTASSISVYLQGNTTDPAVVKVHLYDNSLTPIASSVFTTLDASGIGTWVTIPIPETPMPRGGYAAGIETFSTEVLVAINPSAAPPQTSFVYVPADADWYYMSNIPFIRLNTKATSVSCNLSASSGISSDVTCSGNTDGYAVATGSGGTGPYTYNWSNGASTDSIGGLSSGMYNVLVTDASGCMYQMAFEIVEPDVTVITLSGTDITCNGGVDGSITTAVSGGTSPYTYTWSDSSLTGASVTGLSAGAYSVTVDDANGCPSVNASVTIAEPASMVLTFTQSTAACGLNGSASVSVSGGVAPYGYLWDDGLAQTTATATDLLSDQYTCTVTDSNGCSASVTDSVQGTPPVTVTISSNNPSGCSVADGDATVTVVTGTPTYFYSWDDPGSQNTATAVGLAAGIYNVTVTDAVPCMTTASIIVDDPGAATLQTSTVDVMCLGGNDGTVSVLTSGGTSPFNYSWNTSPAQTGTTATGLAAGSYTVSVVDFSGCSSFATDTVTEPSAALTIDGVAVMDITCNGADDGSLTVTSSGGTGTYTYAWTGGPSTATYSNVGEGTYTVVVTDANGCTATDSGTVTEPTALSVTSSVTHVTCNGDDDGAIDLTVTGGTAPYSYMWTGGSTDSSLALQGPGNFIVTVTDNNGCTANDVALINEPDALVAAVDTFTNETAIDANDGTINASTTGGTSPNIVLWAGPAGFSSTSLTLISLTPGDYDLTITDANGCSATLTQTIAPVPVGIEEVINHVVFRVYPNPNTGQFIVELNNLNNDDYQIEIRNIIGQLVLTENVTELSGNFYKQIDLTSKETGVYFISLSNEEDKITKKLVVY